MVSKRKRNIIFRLFIIVCLQWAFVQGQRTVSAQDTINLSVLSLNACDWDTLNVPVYASNFINVGSVGIKLKYDTTNLISNGLQNINSKLNGSIYNVTKGECIFAWATTNTPANIGNAKLFDMVYTYKGGISSVAFLPGCEIIDIKTYKPYIVKIDNGTINDTSGFTVNGKVTYDNVNSSPLKNIKLILFNKEGKAIDSTVSD